MRDGDQIVLMIRETGKQRRMVVKEILIDEVGPLAITTEDTSPGWPERLRLRPEQLEESPVLLGPRALYFYQTDVSKP
jgi:hypothetical protein